MSDPNAQAKTRQKIIIGVAVGGILTLMGAGMFFFDSTPVAREKTKAVSIAPPGGVEDRDLWRAQQAAQEKNNSQALQEQKATLKALAEKNEKLQKEMEDLKTGKTSGGAVAGAKADANILSEPLPANNQRVLNAPTGPGGSTPAGAKALNVPLNQQPLPGQEPKRELEIIKFGPAVAGAKVGDPGDTGKTELLGFPVSEQAKKYGASQGKVGARKQTEFIPAGSFVRVTMLNGVDAPTGGQSQSNPIPVVFHVLDPANLPSKYKLDVRDCRVVGVGWGDLSSERTLVRLETLSCVLGTGETVEMPIKGQAIGEDGKVGLRGRLVTKQGQVLANALVAGIASGMGRAFQQSAATVSTSGIGTAQTIDPAKVGQAALGSGLAEAGNALAQYYIRAAEKMFPVIETDGGRVVELAVTKGAVYTGRADLSGDNYRGLLKRQGSRSYEDD